MTPLQDRNPTPRELFLGMAAALERLGGPGDLTDAAIQAEMAADEPDFERAAATIGVPLDDLVDCFKDEMWKRGFVIARKWSQ